MPQYDAQYFDMTLRADEEQSTNNFVSDCINYQVTECDYNYQFWKDSYHSKITSQQNVRTGKPSTNQFMIKKRPGFDDVHFTSNTGCDSNLESDNVYLQNANYKVYDIDYIDGERYLILASKTQKKLRIYKEFTNGKGGVCSQNLKDICETGAIFSNISNKATNTYERDRDECSMPTFAKFPRVKGIPISSGKAKPFLYKDAAGISHFYIEGATGIIGEYIYIHSTYLAGQYVEIIQNVITFVDDLGVSHTGIEVTPIKGLTVVGDYGPEFDYTRFNSIGETLHFPTANGIIHLYQGGNNPCDSYFGVDGNTANSGQIISGLGITSRGGITYLDLNKGTLVRGEGGTQAFYTGNFQPLNKSFTDVEYIREQYAILLGPNSIVAAIPIYDNQNTFVRLSLQTVLYDIGYLNRGSRDVDTGYMLLMTSDHMLSVITPQVMYGITQFEVAPAYTKYDDEFTRIIPGEDNVTISANNRNRLIFVAGNENRVNIDACVYTKVYQRHAKTAFRHKWQFDNMIVTGYRYKTRFGQGVFCENCTGQDNGVYFPTHVIFRHGDLNMYSPKIDNYIRFMFGQGSRFLLGDNRITYNVEFSGTAMSYTHAGFMQTKYKNTVMHKNNDECREDIPEGKELLLCEDMGGKIYDGHGRDNRNRTINNCLEHDALRNYTPTIQKDRAETQTTSCGMSTDFTVGKLGIMDDSIGQYYHILFIDLQTIGAGCFDLYGIFIQYTYPDVNLFHQADNMVFDYDNTYQFDPVVPGRQYDFK